MQRPSTALVCTGVGSQHNSMKSKSSHVYLQVFCCHTSLLLACVAEQHWAVGDAFAVDNGAVHWCWIMAHLYEKQIFTGISAVT